MAMRMHVTTRKQLMTLRRRRLAVALVGALAMPVAPAVLAQSLPDAGSVTSGSATINQAGSQMTITQTSQGAIIDWGSFNIDPGYGVVFDHQLGANSVTLNRVIGYGAGPGLSTIAGSLTANGRVFLINPAGITFAGTAQVNVGSLVASTVDLADADFLAGIASGQFVFQPMTAIGDQRIQIDQGAQIAAAAAGTVALLGRQVSNSGSISAPGGSVLFGSAENITLDFQGDGLTMLTIQGPGIAKPGSFGCPSLPCPGPVLPQLANFGTITANGGQILMRTAATAAATGGVIVNAGTLRAQSLVSRNGRVELTSEGGLVALGLPSPVGSVGVIDVSGQSGASGGTVYIRGSDFFMFNDDPNPLNPDPASNGSLILAFGDTGGGQVDIQVDNLARIYSRSAIVADGSAGDGGQVSVSGATIELGAQAGISASSKGGDGGRISLLGGSGGMSLFGTLAARGVTAGGAITTSTSADSFDFRGLRVDAGSPVASGLWTLSLPDVTVIAGSDSGELDSATGGTYLQDAELNTAFANNTRVTLNSADSVLFDDAQIIAGGSVPLAFTVNAQRAITGSGFSIIGRSGPLAMRFNADAGATHPGDGWIDFSNATLDSNGGDILMYGQSDAINGFASGASSGIRLYASVLASGGGAVLLRGASTGDVVTYGDAGVSLYQVPIDAGGGQVTIVGNGAQAAAGVYMRGDSIDIRAGGVDIRGRASGSGNGVAIYDVGITTSGGDLLVDGEGGGDGVFWRSYGNGLYANGGDIRIHGLGSGGDGVVLVGSLDSGGGAIAVDGLGGQGSGVVFRSGYSGGIASGGGDIDLAGTGYVNGVALIGFGYGNNRLDSAGGAVRIDGSTSGLDGSGVLLNSIQVLAGAGDIRVQGLGPQAEGVRMSNDSLLQTTSGDIDLTSVGYNLGFGLYGGQILTDTGNLSLHARGLGAYSDGLVIGQYASLVSNGGTIDLAGEGG
ncbi:MAG: filamentous hemagglutinin N-terminal domain-containing protein, partial [Thermomonas sp.]